MNFEGKNTSPPIFLRCVGISIVLHPNTPGGNCVLGNIPLQSNTKLNFMPPVAKEQKKVTNPWLAYAKEPQQSDDFDASKMSFGDFLAEIAPEDVETIDTQWGMKIVFYDEDNNRFPVNISKKLGKFDSVDDAEDFTLSSNNLVLYYGESENGHWMTVGKEGTMKTTGRKKFDKANYKFKAGS
jgi:hypothetical protein